MFARWRRRRRLLAEARELERQADGLAWEAIGAYLAAAGAPIGSGRVFRDCYGRREKALERAAALRREAAR